MKKVILIFAVCAICFQYGCSPKEAISPGQSQLTFEMNKSLRNYCKSDEPGIAVLASYNGKILFKNAFGSADLESKTPLNADMIFNAGNITREITATAIMQLVEKGKLSVKDPITKFIPDYPMQGNNITIEHLLTQTSGISDYTKLSAVTEAMKQKEMSSQELINLFKNEKVAFAPGTAFANCNSGFVILGSIIEKVSGQTYAQYSDENILKPAGMKNAFFGKNAEASKIAKGYVKVDNGFKNQTNPGFEAENAALGLNLTVEDYLAFHQALYTGKLIARASLDKMQTAYKLTDGKSIDYGYGLEVKKFEGQQIYSQSGSEKGFYINQFYLPLEDIQILVFANRNPYKGADVWLSINTFLQVITEVNSSIAFHNSDSTRIQFYHFLFQNVVIPSSGIIPEGKKVSIFINGVLPNVHYTIDGTEPTINSPAYDKKIELTKPCVLKVICIPASTKADEKAVSYTFTHEKSPEPINDISGLKPGLSYSYVDGDFNSIPDFVKMTPKRTGIAELPDLSVTQTVDTFAIQFTGYIYIEKDDLYNIYTISDDGSQLFLNEELIIDSNGSHGNFPMTHLVPLKKGYYALKVLYFEKYGHEILQAGYWTEGNEPKKFSKEILFHKE